MICALCGHDIPLGEQVVFGVFVAHAGCHDDFYRDYADDSELFDTLESQEQ